MPRKSKNLLSPRFRLPKIESLPLPQPLNFGEKCISSPQGQYPFVQGNQLSTDANLSAESRKKKLEAMIRGWRTKARQRAGEKVRNVEQKKMRSKRIRLRVTIAKEAREIQEIARMSASEAMKTLAEIMQDPSEQATARIAASNVILERAYGKATQHNVNENHDVNGKPKEVSGKELDTRIEKTLKRVEAIAGGAGEETPSPERPPDLRLRH